MKTMSDVRTALKNELDQWYIKQTRNIYEDYYLYHLPTTAEHDGGFLFCKEKPANPDYELSGGGRVNKGATVEQNFNYFIDILRRLPILSIQ